MNSATEQIRNPQSVICNPLVWLGAKSPFGIALPDAKPSATQLYAPRGVFLNDEYLVAADSGNHRVLIWRGIPENDQTPADIVLGQPDFETEIVLGQKNFEKNGEIIAVKGIGGFYLVCDARNDAVLQNLRERKGRVDKPFAVMCKNLKAAKNQVEISEAEAGLLQSNARPIVLLKKKRNDLSELIAPNNQFLGEKKFLKVQYHHAHIAAVMAENGVKDEKVIGFAFDGTGYGTDGKIWGGEVLIADYTGFERAAHLRYFPLAGGDVSVKNVYRQALSILRESGIDWTENLPCVKFCAETERKILLKQLESNINTVETSSLGRIFDAVASIVGVRQKATYEAQAAIEFESLMDETVTDSYQFGFLEGETILIDYRDLIRELVADVLRKTDVSVISAKFHNAVARLISDLSMQFRQKYDLQKVALSGGCFQNVSLLKKAVNLLNQNDFEVLIHSKVPPNDGGIALGQAVIASRQLQVKSKR